MSKTKASFGRSKGARVETQDSDSDVEDITDAVALEEVAKHKSTGGRSQVDSVARFKAAKKPLTLGNLHELIMALPLGKLCETTFQQRWAGEMLMVLARYLRNYDPTSWCYLFEANLLTDKSMVSCNTEAPDNIPDLRRGEKPSWYTITSEVITKYSESVDKGQKNTSYGFIKRKMQLRSSSGGNVTGADVQMLKFADIVCGFVAKLFYSQAQEGYNTDILAAQDVLGKTIWAGYMAAKMEFKSFFEQKLILIDEGLINLYPNAETAEKESEAIIVTHFDVDDELSGKQNAVEKRRTLTGEKEEEEKRRYPKRSISNKRANEVSPNTPQFVRGSKRRQFFNVDEEITELEREADILSEQRDNCKRQLKIAEDKLAECQGLLVEAQEKRKKQQVDAKVVVELRNNLPAENFEETSHIAIETVGRLYNAYKKTTETPTEMGYRKYCNQVLNAVQDLNKSDHEDEITLLGERIEVPSKSASGLQISIGYQEKRKADEKLNEGDAKRPKNGDNNGKDNEAGGISQKND